MPLTHDQLVELAVDRYFIACNNHDHKMVVDTFAEDCVMRFASAKYRYEGKEALDVHFRDFLGTFKVINFHNFENVVDVKNQSVASQFVVQLVDHDGEELLMKNCNFFHTDKAGLFRDIMIYNSSPIQKGFEAGSL